MDEGGSVVGLRGEVRPGLISNLCSFPHINYVASLIKRGLYVRLLTATPALSTSMLSYTSVQCSATADGWFSSLVSLVCSEILVNMCTLPHEQGMLDLTGMSFC
jgi:hypothetical protein